MHIIEKLNSGSAKNILLQHMGQFVTKEQLRFKYISKQS